MCLDRIEQIRGEFPMGKLIIALLVLLSATSVAPAFSETAPGKEQPATGGSSSLVMSAPRYDHVFTMVGPFVNEADCKSINEWAKKESGVSPSVSK